MKLKRGHFNNQGKFFSFKMGKTVLWKSLLEFDYIHLLEIDSLVQKFYKCDFKIAYSFSGEALTLTPNYIVIKNSVNYLTYLSTSEKIENHTEQLKSLAHFCLAEGYVLEIVLDEEIRKQPRLSNCKIINKYATKSLNDPLPILLCYQLFQENQTIQLNSLVKFFEHNGASKREIFRLIYHGVLSIDINQPISDESSISFLNNDFK